MQDKYAGYSGTYIIDSATGERVPDAATAAALRALGHPDHQQAEAPEPIADAIPAPAERPARQPKGK